MENFERFSKQKEREDKPSFYETEVRKLRDLTVEFVQHYGKDGISLTHEGRVNPLAFTGLHDAATLKIHRDYVRKKDDRIREYETDKDKSMRILSDCFEQIVPIILTKVAPERLIVVRSSKYDDYRNGVDTIIIDRETGNIICSVDEVIPVGGKIERGDRKERKGK